MTREDIIRMAREAGLAHFYDSEGHCTGITDARLIDENKERNDERLVEMLAPFATLVAAAKEAELNDGLTIAFMHGYEKGKDAGAAAEREAKEELLAALQDLLMDSQHAEHECGDKNCPVAHAIAVALKYDSIRARGQQ